MISDNRYCDLVHLMLHKADRLLTVNSGVAHAFHNRSEAD